MSREPGEAETEGARHRGRRVVGLALVGGAIALLVNEGLRNRLLDLLFGAEEEFDYSTLTEPPEPSRPPGVPTEPFVRARPAEEPTAGAEQDASWDADLAGFEEPQAQAPPAIGQLAVEEDEEDEDADEEDEEDEDAVEEDEDEEDEDKDEEEDEEDEEDEEEGEPHEGEALEEVQEPDEDEAHVPSELDPGEPAGAAAEEPDAPRISIAPSPAAWHAAAAAVDEEASESVEPPTEAPNVSEPHLADEREEPPVPPVGWWSPTRSGSDPR